MPSINDFKTALFLALGVVVYQKFVKAFVDRWV